MQDAARVIKFTRRRKIPPMLHRIFLTITLVASIASAVDLVPATLPSGLGVNIHFTDTKPGEVKMLADAGFKFIRMDFDWHRIEKSKGEYDFSAYDRLLAALDPHGIRAVFILDYANPLYDQNLSPHSDEGRAAFAKWAAESVKHFKGRHVLWEMYNEPNIQFWRPHPNVADYIKLALAVGKAIKEAAPDEPYVGPATSRIDFAFLEKCFQAGLLEYWDAVTVHPYRQQVPETAAADYRELQLMIAHYAPKAKHVPIYSGEWGYSSPTGGLDPESQGKFLPRQWLTNLMNDVPLSIWYDWHDDGTKPDEPEHHFGTVLNEYHEGRDPVYDPKPAYRAAKALTSLLDGYRFNKRLSAGSPDLDYLLMFDKGQDVRLVAWTTVTERKHDISIPASPGKFTTYNHVGDKLEELEAADQGLTVAVTDAPVYIVPEKPNELLRVGAAWERVPPVIMGKAAELKRVLLKVSNPLDKRIYISSPSAGPSSTQWLAAGRTVSIPARISLLREPHLVVLPIQLKIGQGPAMGQDARLLVTDAIDAEVRPPVGRTLPIRILNPSGEPFDGSIRATSHGPRDDVQTQPLRLNDGQREQIMFLPVLEGLPVSVEILDPLNHSFFVAYKWRFNPIELHAQDYQLHASGDKDVKSTQSLEQGVPPDMPPGPGLNSALKIAYDFDPGWKYLGVQSKDQAFSLPGKPKALGIWVRGDGSGNLARMRFVDASKQTFQPDAGPLADAKWHYLLFPLDGSQGGHWGGTNSGVIEYPIRLETLLLIDSAAREKTGGTVYVADPTIIYETRDE